MIWTPHATVATLIEQDRKLLFVEEKSDQGKLVLNQPAGHVEKNESIFAAAVRETREETGWEVELTHLLGLYTYLAPNGVMYYRICFIAQPVHKISDAVLDTDIIATHWLTQEQLRYQQERLRSPLVLRCVDDFYQGKRYPLSIVYEHSSRQEHSA